MIVFLQLTTAGVDSGPFDLYSNLDGYSEPFEENVSRASLIAGYSTDVPDYATVVRITSKEDCISSVDITLRDVECDLEGYTGEITTTSTSTSTSTSTTTTTTANPCPNCIPGTEVTIGTQIWTGCNLDVETYRDGTTIPQVTDPTQWQNLTTGAWCYYDNDSANGPIYGKIYNFYAVAGIDGSGTPRSLAPVGYHVPSKSEFDTLVTYLGGESVAGGKMKEPNLCHWSTPNILLTPYSGFAALPGGYRNNVAGIFQTLGNEGTWWSSSESSTNPTQNGLSIILSYNDTTVFNTQDTKQRGFSVRLIKD